MFVEMEIEKILLLGMSKQASKKKHRTNTKSGPGIRRLSSRKPMDRMEVLLKVQVGPDVGICFSCGK
jgi:hypothetical protein